MECTNPVNILSESIGKVLKVPCGKCTRCRIARTREWTVRIMHEANYHPKKIFTTLTFNNENLPLDQSIRRNELQKFIKRLRKRVDRKIKYYACGEYGENGDRPHYHAILFSMSLKAEDQQAILDCWPYGFVKNGTVTYDSARYVAQYINKKLSGKQAKEQYGDREPPFCLMSKGLGKQYALDNRDQLIKNKGCTIRGKQAGLPRYYMKVLDIDKDFFVEDAIKREKELEDYHAKREGPTKAINGDPRILENLADDAKRA